MCDSLKHNQVIVLESILIRLNAVKISETVKH